MLGAVGREEEIGEELVECVACVSRPVLDVIAHGGLQALHKLLRGCAQLLNNLVPLVDVWGARRQGNTSLLLTLMLETG